MINIMDNLKASFLLIMRGLIWRRTWMHNDTPVAPLRADAGSVPIHPLLGALKGFVRVTPETDLTKPVDPGWERQ
jgi:hypothetical protein